MKKENIFWGILLLAIGGGIFLNALFDVPDISFNIWMITVFLLAIYLGIKLIQKRNFVGIMLIIATIIYFLGEYLWVALPFGFFPLKFGSVSFLGTFGGALLIGIALEILLNNKKKSEPKIWQKEKMCEKTTLEQDIIDETFTENGEYLHENITFTQVTRYLRASNLRQAQFSCQFASLDIRLDDFVLAYNQVLLDVHCSFGQVNIFIPRAFVVENKMIATLGSITDSRKGEADASVPKLILQGQVTFGEIKIIYI